MSMTISPNRAVIRFMAGVTLSSFSAFPLSILVTLIVALSPSYELSTDLSMFDIGNTQLFVMMAGMVLSLLMLPVTLFLRGICGARTRAPYIIAGVVFGFILGMNVSEVKCYRPLEVPSDKSSSWYQGYYQQQMSKYERCVQELPTSAGNVVQHNYVLITPVIGGLCGLIFWLVSGVRYQWELSSSRSRSSRLARIPRYIQYGIVSGVMVCAMPFMVPFLFLRLSQECGFWPILLPPSPELVPYYLIFMGMVITMAVSSVACRIHGISWEKSVNLGLLFGTLTVSCFVITYLCAFGFLVKDLVKQTYGDMNYFLALGIGLATFSAVMLYRGRGN